MTIISTMAELKHNDYPTVNNSDDSDDNDDTESPLLSIQDGLSLESLLALQHFQAHGCFEEDNDSDNDPIPQDTICVSYTPQDSQVIAETYRRLQQKAELSSKQNQDALEQRSIQELLVEPCQDGTNTVHIDGKGNISSIDSSTVSSRAALSAKMLESDGVVRIDQVVSKEMAHQCLEAINAALVAPDSTKDESDSAGFGNVFSRRCRYDMYLRPVGVYKEALQSILSPDSVAGQLFRDHLLPHDNSNSKDTAVADGTQDPAQPGVFHELSALICDPSADSQPIHPDASYTDDNLAPLWTVFVALQDVQVDMGATVFLPRTHQKHVHADLNTADPEAKNHMLAHAEYRRSTLKAGDCAIMDARTLHFGSANTSEMRRVLLYFTIRNPRYGTTDADFPKCGSLFSGLHMTTADFIM